MIKEIREINFPSYATLSQATVSLQDMADKTITSTVSVSGTVVPDFSCDWEIEFKDEKYIMPLREPPGTKDNTSILSSLSLTFQHWAVFQLKRWLFFTMQPIESGTAVPDEYEATVALNLGDFCNLFSQVLEYYFGNKITIALNDDWRYDPAPSVIEISKSYLWDVLSKMYEVFAVRWQIEPAPDNDNNVKNGERYVIRVGYPTDKVDHVFKYGFDGGLLKVERQVQDENIRNIILGRGGEKNLPYRYYKDVDENNKSFPNDPDWIPELKDIHFSELRGATFRSYVQGWNHKHYGRTKVTAANKSYAPWAWLRGYSDSSFHAIEYVADEFSTEDNGYAIVDGSSIAKYGELMGAVENNDEIYPSIQGVVVDGLGRVDESVYMTPIEMDVAERDAYGDAQLFNVQGTSGIITLEKEQRQWLTIVGGTFTVPKNQYANFDEGEKTIGLTKDKTRYKWKYSKDKHRWTIGVETYQVDVEGDYVVIENAIVDVVDVATGDIRSASGIPEGTYQYRVRVYLYNSNSTDKLNVSIDCPSPTLTIASIDEEPSNTWCVWIKNIWMTSKAANESDAEYAERVWRPILGDHLGSEAKLAFSDGRLGVNEDYEFVIVSMPQHDETRTIISRDGNTYPSHWKITLGFSDADLETTGLMLPSTKTQASPGDHFIFLGIDLPHQYVLWAEERLDDWKKDELAKVSNINPTWVVSLDPVRIHNNGNDGALVDDLRLGSILTIQDERFIGGNNREQLYIQSITYTYKEPTDKDANILPDITIVLSDEYSTSLNPIGLISGEINALQRQIGSLSNIEGLIRVVGNKLFLRKDGFADRSVSPTEFASLVTSENFRNGIVGGLGWGFFKDANNNWVLEVDRISVRQQMQINSLVINQTEARGGLVVESAAALELTNVVLSDDGYTCYFDQRGGSIANLFQIDDVALCHRFTPENRSLKFYKRRVIDVAQNFLVLSLIDVDGDGIPEEGDVIVQYGSYTQLERQYVVVRDVVSGGYERYIEGLDSVNTDGVEYYFAGRQAGMYNNRPRFFVGDEAGFIEYRDGVFSIKGKLAVGTDLGGLTSVEDGLILSSEIRLGERDSDGSLTVKSGMSGNSSNKKSGGQLAFWAGGDRVEPDGVIVTEWGKPTPKRPKFGVRFDGSAFASGNTVRFLDNELWVGKNVLLDDEGLKLLDGVSHEERLRITNTEIPDLDNIEGVANRPISFIFSPSLLVDVVDAPTSTGAVSELPGIYLTNSQPYTYELNAITKGSSINGTIDVVLSTDKDIVGGYVEVKLLSGTKTVLTKNGYFSFKSAVLTRASVSINYTVSEDAEISMIVQIKRDKTPTQVSYQQQTSISIEGGGIVQYGTTTRTVLGMDGFASFWGNAVLGVKAGDVMMRCGNFGIRITPTGIKKLVGGSRWEDADI